MCGGSWSFRVCGGLPRGVAVLGDRRPLGNSAAWHTRAKGYSAQAVKPDVCRCAEIEKKHISSTTVSTRKLAMKNVPNSRLSKVLKNFSFLLVFSMRTQRLTTNPLPRPFRVSIRRPRVCRHHAHMLKHVCAWCPYTRARFERTHGDVLSGHTPHTTPHHTTTTRPQHHTETETEKEDRQREEKTKEKKTRQEKIEDSFSGWSG